MTEHSVHETIDPLAAVSQKVLACMQCGTCSGSCPNAFAMDLTPRQLWRLAQLGDRETIFKSKTPITIDKIAKYLTETDGFNPDRDSITFLDDTIETVNLK